MDGANGGSTVPNTNSGVNANPPPPFLCKTYDMVDDPSSDSIVSWSPSNNSFVVWNPPEFSRDLLPKYFKHNNFSSFVRQLNTYGFRKVDPDRWEFANEGFLRGQKHLLKSINRRKPSHAQTLPQQPQVQSSSVGICVEVGKFGIEEEIERLKRDKNVLMQELVRLRQQQQATDNQLQTVGQRLQGMEQRQQQMMSFLAKAMQSPGFLAQLVQQNDSNRRIVGENKKRRLPKHEDDLDGERAPADGQIIKYQPLMSDAAKAMFKQILKLDPSPKLEPSNASDGILTNNLRSTSEVLDTGSSSSRVSGVTLAEVAPSCSLSCASVSSEFFGTSRPSAAISEAQSSASMSDKVTTAQVSDITSSTISVQDDPLTPELPEIIFTELPQIQGVALESDVDISNQSFVMPETEGVIIDPMAVGEDGSILIGQEKFGEDTEMDNFFYGNDVSWEQFLSASPISGDIEEVESNSQEGNTTKETESKPVNENSWNKAHYMDHLTEQMGLLTSKNKGLLIDPVHLPFP